MPSRRALLASCATATAAHRTSYYDGLAWFFGNKGEKIFQRLGAPQPNFRIVATPVREPRTQPSYVLDDPAQLPALVDKWQFPPKADPLSRCGYDYRLTATNGDATLTASLCFLCGTLVLADHTRYRISRSQILRLLRDFRPLK